MTAQKQIVRQRDFSGGEIVAHAKRRDDEAVVRSAVRVGRNVRILASCAVEQRPGRRALIQAGRTEEVRMSPTVTYHLCFSNGSLRILDSACNPPGTTQGGYSWTTATLHQIVWTQIDNDIVMTYPGQVPKIARWDGATAWTFLDWAAAVSSGGQKRVPFYRISKKDVTMLPSGRTGNITLTFSEAIGLVAGHVGTRMRFVGRQVTITALTGNPAVVDATVNEPLPGSQVISFATDPRNVFALGDTVEGSVTGSKGYVTGTTVGNISVQLITTSGSNLPSGGGERGIQSVGSVGFTTADTAVGPGGGLPVSAAAAIGIPVAVPLWEDEVFNAHRGWPRSVSNDQVRLIFCDFPGLPAGVAWSALATPNDFYPGPAATDAIFETVPKKSRVYHVMEGADETVYTDKGVYYVPISEANPLRPGSVAFRRIPGPPGSAVRPVTTSQGVVYANSGLNRILAVVGTGQTAMPWKVVPVSDLHELFVGVKCLAVEEGDGTPPVEHVYAVNSNSSVAVGRYQPGKEWVGWVLWDGVGTPHWVSVLGGNVTFSVEYAAGILAERVDPAQWLDAAAVYNAVPAALAPGGGQSVFWYLASSTLKVMSSRRYLGDRVIGATGAVTLSPGDAFTTQTFGHGFNIVLEPFLPHMQGGQSVGQTMNARQVSNAAVAVQNSTGFDAEYWNPNTAAFALAFRRPPFDAGDNQSNDPPLREEAVTFKVDGSNHDPRIRVVKTFPGPLRILEISAEVGA